MVYLQPNVVIVYDRVQTAPGTTQTWQLAAPVAPEHQRRDRDDRERRPHARRHPDRAGGGDRVGP